MTILGPNDPRAVRRKKNFHLDLTIESAVEGIPVPEAKIDRLIEMLETYVDDNGLTMGGGVKRTD